MRLIFHLSLLTICVTHGGSSLLSQLRNSVANFFENVNFQPFKYEDPKEKELNHGDKDSSYVGNWNQEENPTNKQFQGFKESPIRTGHKQRNDVVLKKKNIKSSKKKRTKKPRSKKAQGFRKDQMLNFIRRNGNLRRSLDAVSSSESSSSLETPNWKNEWKEHWFNKKIEAIKSTGKPRGDVVNMVAARPWGVPCGDPDQHDMPWGTCMMAMECDAEYRIFRGDYFCGRTQFVCCAIQLTNYDMYQGFDLSFADSGLSTDSNEKKNKSKHSKRKKKARERRKRRKQRLRRKKKIKKTIKKIVREMKRILNKSYRNGTSQRKKKTKELKKFIKDLKKKFKNDRKVVSNIHDKDLMKIDEALLQKLNDIKGVNKNFLTNSTFRDIVTNGKITKESARMLVEAYPELAAQINKNMLIRRSGHEDYLDYDVEYGMHS